MFAGESIRRFINSGFSYAIKRKYLVWCSGLAQNEYLSLLRTTSCTPSLNYITAVHLRSYDYVPAISFIEASSVSSPSNFLCGKCVYKRYMSSASIELKTDSDVVRFSISKCPYKIPSSEKGKKPTKHVKMSKKAKLNELRFYRLKAKKKMNSPNPEVRIRYKLEKHDGDRMFQAKLMQRGCNACAVALLHSTGSLAKRKEAWLIEKLSKFEVPKLRAETCDPEMLTEEEKHYLKRTGEKKKNFILVGRRGVFGGVVLNMHLHWKKHETVKIICKPCKPGQIHQYAEELARLSKGIVIDIRPNNSIIFYRGKNYVQPTVMSPPDTLSKNKALEKYKYEQSLEHTSQFIEKLEKELEEYLEHVARYKKGKEGLPQITIAEA